MIGDLACPGRVPDFAPKARLRRGRPRGPPWYQRPMASDRPQAEARNRLEQFNADRERVLA
jgi:hypothetical protein